MFAQSAIQLSPEWVIRCSSYYLGNGIGNTYMAFVWDATHGMQSVKDIILASGITAVADWELTIATAVSDDGLTIAGEGD